MTAVSTGRLVEIIYDDLSAWCCSNGGECYLAPTPWDLINLLEEGPNNWRVILQWEGDESADPRVRAAVVRKHRLRIIVDARLGFTLKPGLALIKGTASRSVPVLDLLDAVQDRILAYRFPWLAEPNNRVWYAGTDDQVPLPDGTHAAAYVMTFYLYAEREESATAIDLTP